MPRQSNKALEKYNKPTAESIQAKQAKELVDDEYNDIRRQIIRREFDQVNLYNELFNRETENFGDILLDHKLMELFNKYIQEIGESIRRLGENRPNPFNDLIGAYNAFTSSLSSYVDLAKKKNTKVNTKAFEDKLRESAIPLQELLNLALGMVSGAVPSVPVAAPAPAPSYVNALMGRPSNVSRDRLVREIIAEQEDRRRPAYEDEHPDNPFLADEAVQGAFDRALARRQQRQSGLGKAHGGSAADFFKNFAMNFLLNKRVGRGKAHGGMNTDFIWKLLLGAGKAHGGNKPTEDDILQLFNLLKEVQRGFVPNQPFRGVSAMTESEKKRQKSQLDTFEGAYATTSDFSAAFMDLAELLRSDRLISERPPENGVSYSAEEIQSIKDAAEHAIQEYINETSRSEYAQKGEYRPGEKTKLDNELKKLNKELDKTIKVLTRYGRGRGKAHGNHPKTDTNFGQLMADAEARNPRKKNCHYNTRGFLISCGKGKAHGGQAGFSIEKTREIVDQWPGFPYHVPPASKTGPMLKNPRSRVNNRTEANGKPRRICKRDMSAEAIACRKGEDPPKRGRPRKLSPKSPKEGGKRICKMDMSEGSIACRNADKPKKSTMPKPIMRGPAKPKAAGKKLRILNEKLSKIDKDLGKKLAESEKNKAAGKKKAKKSGKPKYNVI